MVGAFFAFLLFFLIYSSEMLRAIGYFVSDGLHVDLNACNVMIERDLGKEHRLNAACLPDLIMVAKEGDGDRVVGVMALRFVESTRAWEILFVSAAEKYKHTMMMKFLVDSACSSIRIRHGRQYTSWLVRRVQMDDTEEREWLRSIGFILPDKWLKHVLSDEGFIPFDPFDQVLMKRRVDELPPAAAGSR